jgi:hypothetical protein
MRVFILAFIIAMTTLGEVCHIIYLVAWEHIYMQASLNREHDCMLGLMVCVSVCIPSIPTAKTPTVTVLEVNDYKQKFCLREQQGEIPLECCFYLVSLPHLLTQVSFSATAWYIFIGPGKAASTG